MSGEMLHARIGHVSALMCLQQLEVRQSILQTAVASAAAKGVLFVSSAGNDHSSNDVTPHWPSNIASDTSISVAALDKTGGLWYAARSSSTHLMLCHALRLKRI